MMLTMFISIAILYSCPFLGQDCGQCLAIEDVYGCGYCRNPTNRCILTSTCTSSFAVLTDLSQVRVCEDPVITDVSSNTLTNAVTDQYDISILYCSLYHLLRSFSGSFLQLMVPIMVEQ